jgi:hypothetical protein
MRRAYIDPHVDPHVDLHQSFRLAKRWAVEEGNVTVVRPSTSAIEESPFLVGSDRVHVQPVQTREVLSHVSAASAGELVPTCTGGGFEDD